MRTGAGCRGCSSPPRKAKGRGSRPWKGKTEQTDMRGRMILDPPIVSQRIFFPRPTDLEPDLVVDVGDGAQLGCYVQHGPPRSGMVVHFHGNGELASEYATHHAEM